MNIRRLSPDSMVRDVSSPKKGRLRDGHQAQGLVSKGPCERRKPEAMQELVVIYCTLGRGVS